MYIYLNLCKKMTDVKFLLFHSNTWDCLTMNKQMIKSELNDFYWIEICEII